ncbi:MAG: energy transducer TonB [Ignavibacteria bacterium]|nr:energy transducer TonB [Ignavibacteria bacterium]
MMDRIIKTTLLVIAITLLMINLNSISANNWLQGDDYLAFAEVMPAPVGGYPELYKKIKYPEVAQKAGIKGKVYMIAFIDETGKVVECTLLRGIGGGCDEVAMEAVKGTKFTPGMNNNKPVKVKASITVPFEIK